MPSLQLHYTGQVLILWLINANKKDSLLLSGEIMVMRA
jgi:hypothetical protein